MAENPDGTTLRREITRIRVALRCTEAEAFFALRSITYPHPATLSEKLQESDAPPRHSRRRALHHTRDIISKMEEYRVMADRGHFEYFLRALEVCGATGFPLPSWVSERIGKARIAYSRHMVATVDEAFGADTPPHYKDEKYWDRYCRSVEISNRCLALQKTGLKIGVELFETVAEEFGVSASTVRDHYYAWKKIVETPAHPTRRRGRPPGKGGKKQPRD